MENKSVSSEPLIIHDHYEIDYRHSYAEDSPFFVGLGKEKLLGSRCTACGYTFATPRAYCMQCGAATQWHELPLTGRVHTFTTCHYGGEAFLKETPFTLILVEFDGADTLFLSRLKNLPPDQVREPDEPGPELGRQYSRRARGLGDGSVHT